jgi:hypothetical protein
MRRRGLTALAIVLGGAGTVLGAALLTGPAAHADDLATLPVPPFDPSQVNSIYAVPPGLQDGLPTNSEQFNFFLYQQQQWDQAWTVSDGSYETRHVGDNFGLPEPFFVNDSDQVTASDGVAPAVGTEWDQSIFQLPGPGYETVLFENTSLTTSAGTVDTFTPENIPFLAAWSNEFYSGPAGMFDDLVSQNGAATVIPIIDIPAEASPGAAADVSTMWSDLVGTL